nr:alpha-catulin-like [Megalopta genalis]
MATPEPVDPTTLEIKTRSIEQTLLPLVKQISTLVSHRERPLCSGRSYRAVDRIGQAVNLAVERFVTVGETIADNNPEIKQDMYEACKEARVAGSAIEKLCECMMDDSLADRSAVIRAARCLLGSVTRVLLVADVVVVNQLLSAKDKVATILDRLEYVSNFTEFVKAFSQFGTEMVDLAHLTGDRQNDLKDERRRAQMAASRQVLERSTMMLLTSSKTYLRHPECPSARENRDTVFCQMRRAMDMIHFIVKDGVLYRYMPKYQPKNPIQLQNPAELDYERRTALFALKHFERLVETTRMTLLGPGCRETLTAALDTAIERTHDFTDSAYTSHEHRENILLLCDRVKLELNSLLRVGNSMQNYEGGSGSPSAEMEQAVQAVFNATKDLRQQLCATAMEQMADLGQVTKAGLELVSTIKNLALANDINSFEETKFEEYLDHIVEVCRIIRHVAPTETLSVSAKFTAINLKMYGPQVLTAARTLARHPTSKIAKENLEEMKVQSDESYKKFQLKLLHQRNILTNNYCVRNHKHIPKEYLLTRKESAKEYVYLRSINQLLFIGMVPPGPHKKDLLENLDRVPTYVQQLQFTVKNPTVGKAATFTKVDNVIQETKNLMNVISKVVTTCFVCATKHNLTMPQYVELSPTTVPGLSEEDCLYPVSPQMLPSTSPYVQPHPLTSTQLHNILRVPSLNFPPFNYNTLPVTSSSGSTGSRSSASFVHPSVLPYSTPTGSATCGPQAPHCLQNLQLLQLQLHHAQLQHLRHATLPR